MTDQQRQLRDEPAQTREQYDFIINLAREANARLTRDLMQARADLTSAKKAADTWFDKMMKHKCNLVRTHDELTQIRSELKDLQGANQALARQLDDVTSSCDFWYKEAHDDEAKLDATKERMATLQRQAAQMEAGRDYWRKRFHSLEYRATEEQAVIVEAAEALIEQTYIGIERTDPAAVKMKTARGKLRETLEYKDKATAKLLERLATLDATEALLKDRQGSLDRACIELDSAEAALADCGIGGIFAEFDGLADAINQMAQYIKELDNRLAQAQADLDAEPIEVEITGKEMVQALQAERQLRQVAETGERAARKMLARAIVAEADAELAVHVHSKAADELAQMVKTERQLQQKAEQRGDKSRRELTAIHLVLSECRVSRNRYSGRPASAITRIYWLNERTYLTEQQRTEYLDEELDAIHSALDECRIPRNYPDSSSASARTRIFWLNQRAEKAEAANDHLRSVASQVPYLKDRAGRAGALAQLVNEEAAELLEQLASNTETLAKITTGAKQTAAHLWNIDAKKARALAAQIREAL